MNKYNKTETDSQIQRTNWWLPVGRGKMRVGDEEVQTTMYKINKLQGYIVQHREYSQYFTVTLNGV